MSLFLSLRICFCFFIFLLPTKTNCLFCVVKKLLKCCLYTQMKKFLLPNVLVKRYMQKIRFNPPFNTYNHKYKHNTTDKYFSMGILLGQLGLVCMLYHWVIPQDHPVKFSKNSPLPPYCPRSPPSLPTKRKKMTKPEWYFVFCLLRYK